MTNRMNFRRLVPLLAMSAVLAIAASAQAQDRHDQGMGGTSASLQVTFGSRPHWGSIRGTSVREINRGPKQDYDVFRYGGNYYAYNNDQWYTSRTQNGQYRMVDEQRVPREFARVPREHWRNYPSSWMDKNRDAQTNGKHRYGDRAAQPADANGRH